MVSDTVQDVNQAIHNVGMAVWVGGTTFGRFAHNPSLSAVQGARLARQAPNGAVPVETGSQPARETPAAARHIQRSIDVLGALNLLSGVGLMTSTGLFWRSAVSHPPWRRALRRRAHR